MTKYQQTANLTKLKALAERKLEKGSTLRFLKLSEPNVLFYEEAMIKLKIYLKLLDRELGC